MKTILVVYTETKRNNVGYMKRYAFNTQGDVSVGDLLKSPNYDTNMQVVKVLDTEYKYFNRDTGDLTNEFSSTKQYEIRELKITEQEKDVVYATKIKEKE